MEEQGHKPAYRVARKDERLTLLLAKLREEALELTNSPVLEELADVAEVLDALMAELRIAPNEVSTAKMRKKSQRGGFDAGVIIEISG